MAAPGLQRLTLPTKLAGDVEAVLAGNPLVTGGKCAVTRGVGVQERALRQLGGA